MVSLVSKTDEEIMDFMLQNGGQFTVEGHYYIYSKKVYAGGKTFHFALQNWWHKYVEKSMTNEYIMLNNYELTKKGEQF